LVNVIGENNEGTAAGAKEDSSSVLNGEAKPAHGVEMLVNESEQPLSSSSMRLKVTQEKGKMDRDLRAKWSSILEAATSMINPLPASVQHRNIIAAAVAKAGVDNSKGQTVPLEGVGNSADGDGGNDVGAVKVKAKRNREGLPSVAATVASLAEAQAVIDEACSLPPYVNEPGENFVEVMRSVLGELMLVVLDAREWEAEARDALYPGASAKGIYINTGRKDKGEAGGFYSHVGDDTVSARFPAAQGLSMKEFRALLTAGTDLRLRTNTEGQLKLALANTKKVFREMSKLLSDDQCSGQLVNGKTSHGGSAVSNTGRRVPGTESQVGQVRSSGSGNAQGSSLIKVQSPARKVPTKGSVAAKASQKEVIGDPDDEDDDDDDDDNEDDRSGGRGRKGKGAGDKGQTKATINHLSDLLNSLNRLPPNLLAARDSYTDTNGTGNHQSTSPASALRELYTLSLNMKDRVEAVLARSAVAKG
jgi:hypothetical protein